MHLVTPSATLVLALALATPLPAQYRCDHFTTEKGLPQNTVAGIAQTPDGYLWLATYDGLVRYDGVHFKVFDKANTPAIGCNWFLTVWVDPAGTLWAGTVEAGLLRYRDGAFRSFPVKTGRSDNGVKSIHPGPTGTPLLGYDDLPLLAWDDANLRAGPAEPRSLRSFTDRFGVTWTLEHDVLVRTLNRERTSFAVQLTDTEFATRRFVDRAGALWLGTRSNGVYRIDGARLDHYTNLASLPRPLGFWVGGEDRDGTVWLFTQAEVIGYRDGRFTPLGAADGLTSQEIRAVFCDREGTAWIGSNDRGLFKLSRRFLTAYAHDEGLRARVIYPIIEDRAGTVWLGSKGELTRRRAGAFTPLPLTTPSRGETDVRCLHEDRAGRLWVGTSDGLFVVAGDTLINRSELINGHQPLVCLEDCAGSFWVGTDNGLVRIRAGSRTVFTTQDGLPERRVRSLHEDRQGRLWVGTVAGLVVLRDGRFVPVGADQTLLRARIRCLHEDEFGTMWVGTYDRGLWRVRDGRLKVYTRESGLPSNGVFQILEDRRGHFWMSCNRGIFRVRRQQLDDYAEGKGTIRCVTYGLEDGMKSIECNGERPPAGVRARDGKLWFPTMHGVVVIDPDAVPDNAQPPRAVLEAALVDRAPAPLAAEVRLQPGQSDLELLYTAPSFLKSEHVHFKYRLVGLSEKWTEAGPRRSAHYAHLPPGKYTFEVRAANSDGVWSDVGATLAVEVLPFFYQTRWFAGACVAGLVGLALGVGVVRVHRLKANARRLAELVSERTLQLEAANARLEELATRDALTGLANRRRFQDFLTQEWQRSRRTGAPLALVLLDVDFFKMFNDTHGHPGGDECLRRVAEVLRTTVNRATDLPARYGGEEFAVVLSDTNREGARVVAEAIRSRVEALAIAHGASAAGPNVTVSLGIAVATGTGTSSAEDLIASADQALYRAKAEGRNRWVENPAGSP